MYKSRIGSRIRQVQYRRIGQLELKNKEAQQQTHKDLEVSGKNNVKTEYENLQYT